jgi:hypothetical protein
VEGELMEPAESMCLTCGFHHADGEPHIYADQDIIREALNDTKVTYDATPGKERAVITGSDPEDVARVTKQLQKEKGRMRETFKRKLAAVLEAEVKPQMGLLPFDALEEVAKVLTHGAKLPGYSPNGWRTRPGTEHFDAMLRHLADYQVRADLDSESNLPVLAHMCCRALFMLSFYLKDEECRH